MHVLLKACFLALAAHQAHAFSSPSNRFVGAAPLLGRSPRTKVQGERHGAVMTLASGDGPRVRDQELLAVLQGQTVDPTWYGQMAVPANQKVDVKISEAMTVLEHRYVWNCSHLQQDRNWHLQV